MNTTLIILGSVLSVVSLLILRREKKKHGDGLTAKTIHTSSRYKILWVLAYWIAIPSALVIHLLKLIKKILSWMGGGIWRWLA